MSPFFGLIFLVLFGLWNVLAALQKQVVCLQEKLIKCKDFTHLLKEKVKENESVSCSVVSNSIQPH